MLADSSMNTFKMGGTDDTHDWAPGATAVARYAPQKNTVMAAQEALVYDINYKGFTFVRTKMGRH